MGDRVYLYRENQLITYFDTTGTTISNPGTNHGDLTHGYGYGVSGPKLVNGKIYIGANSYQNMLDLNQGNFGKWNTTDNTPTYIWKNISYYTWNDNNNYVWLDLTALNIKIAKSSAANANTTGPPNAKTELVFDREIDNFDNFPFNSNGLEINNVDSFLSSNIVIKDIAGNVSTINDLKLPSTKLTNQNITFTNNYPTVNRVYNHANIVDTHTYTNKIEWDENTNSSTKGFILSMSEPIKTLTDANIFYNTTGGGSSSWPSEWTNASENNSIINVSNIQSKNYLFKKADFMKSKNNKLEKAQRYLYIIIVLK